MKFILLLVLLTVTSCRTVVQKPRVRNACGVIEGAPAKFNDASVSAGISETRALRIAIEEFEKHLLPLWSHDIHFKEEEKRWVVIFAGFGLYGPPGSVHVMFIDKATGKVSFVPGL